MKESEREWYPKYGTSESDVNLELLHVPRHESEDQDCPVVLKVGLMVGLLIFWAFVFLESFVIFILASNVKLWPWAFIRRFEERLFSCFEFWPLSNSVVWRLWFSSSSNVCSTRPWVDLEQALWAILSVLPALQLPSTHLVVDQDYVSKKAREKG